MKIETKLKDTKIGKIPFEWEIEKLKNLTSEIFTGSTPPKKIRKYVEDGINFVRSQNVFDQYIDEKNIVKINNESLSSIQRCELKKNDVLLNITGDGVTFLRCCKIIEHLLPAYVNQSIAVIRIEEKKLTSDFLVFFLFQERIKKYMEGFNAGSARRTLAAKHIKEFLIPLPSLEEQIRISKLFKIINSKIKVNYLIKENLENIAQAIFKSWFIDFEPFQDGEFAESELGDIPGGWALGELKKIAKIESGGNAPQKKKHFEDGKYPFVRVKHLTEGVSINDYDMINNDAVVEYRLKKYEAESIIFSKSGVAIRSGKINILPFDSYVVNHIAILKPIDPLINSGFIYCYIKAIHKRLLSMECGTSIPYLRLSDIQNFKVIIPPKEIVYKFSEIVENIFHKIIINQKENIILAKLRDLLLPQLISGRLRIKNPEEFLEEIEN